MARETINPVKKQTMEVKKKNLQPKRQKVNILIK